MFGKEFLQTAVSLLEIIAIIGTLLAAVCGAGYVFANRGLQRILRAESERARQESAQLQIKMQERIAVAELGTAKADEGSAVARVEAARANERAAVAEQRAAEANRTAEAEALERMRLEAIVAPRSLTLEQQRLIGSSLSRFAGRKAALVTYALDAEAAVLGQQITAALQLARIEVQDQTASMMPLGGFAAGVHVTGSEADLATAIASSLASIGRVAVAPVSSRPGGEAAAPAVTILVGVKPVPVVRRQ